MKYINTNKINDIKLSDNNFYLVLDFDKTITSNESLDSWAIAAGKMGESFIKEIDNIKDKYQPIETDYTIDNETKIKYMIEWYQLVMGLYYKYNLTKKQLIESTNENKIELRKGARELLKKLNEKEIPVIILSAGIGNVIEKFLENNDCYYENIYIVSNFMKFKDNKMLKFSDEIIHSLNKTLKVNLLEDIKSKIEQKEYTVLCGNIIEDIKMALEEDLDKTITIGFLDSKEENLKFYKEKFDMVLTKEDSNFEEVSKVIFN